MRCTGCVGNVDSHSDRCDTLLDTPCRGSLRVGRTRLMSGTGNRISRCFAMGVRRNGVANFAMGSGTAGPATTIPSALGVAIISVCGRRHIVRLNVAMGGHWSVCSWVDPLL